MQRLNNPFPLFLDLRGALLDSGFVAIGEAGADPDVSPLTVYWDSAKTQTAEQPLRTRGGMIVNGANPAFVWVDADDYSIRVKDADGNLVFYAASIAAVGGAAVSYQPLDSDLTAIAALSTTAFGRSLLELANAAALKAAAGVVDGLPTSGGTVTGNIIRSGSGAHAYFNDPAMTKPVIYLTAQGAADPRTGDPGEIWLQY